MPRRSTLTQRVLALLTALSAVAFGLAAFGLAAPAGATPAPAGSAAAGTRDLGLLNEQYNLTRLRLDRATVAMQTRRSRLEAAKTRAERVQELVRARAASLYAGAAGDGVAAVLDVGSVNELGRRTQYVSAAAKPDQVLLRDLSRTLDRLETEQHAAAAARDRLRAQAESTAAARRKLMAEAEAAAAARARSQADGAGPVGTPRAMLVASSATGSSARTAPSPAATPAPSPNHPPAPAPSTPPPTTPAPSPPSTTPPAPSAAAATAVAFARAQLGKPYAFATAGPRTFDCSGLTKAAWAAAGVRMDHYSGSQAAAFPKVSWNQLRPGDIVVFYPDFHHVGLYIGNGQMIHAPQTGDVVKIAPAWRQTFRFGVRPR